MEPVNISLKGSDKEKALKAIELNNQGAERYKANELNLACDFFNQAIELAPEIFIFYINRSACLFKMEKFAEALADINKAIELAPDEINKAGCLYQRGYLYFRHGNFEAAIDDFFAVLKLNPKDEANITALACACLAQLKYISKDFEINSMIDLMAKIRKQVEKIAPLIIWTNSAPSTH